ncbi:RidA family protein [Cohnella sp. AR92]|uniref:RidA family protein n=1 Tax=Cohnella sp. AR92 TaxID=648716 RepID=UPI000F8F0C1D|nr:RidA family protein [Cohnella sp. AR92]RUS45563.1 RidA family protein [Cohnella sp. AR92]
MRNDHIVTFPPEWEWERSMPPASIVRTGNTLYLSGQIALGPDGTIVGGDDLKAQSFQCFSNIQAVLARAGASMRDIVKLVTYYACDMTPEAVKAYWEVRGQFFGDYSPASTGVRVHSLIYPDCLIEVEAIAVLPSE